MAYKYCQNPDADEPIMALDNHIGWDDEDGQGIDGSLFSRELWQLDQLGKKRIWIYINSPGGVIVDGMAIYNAILSTKTKVYTYNVFMAASIAAVIFQAGAVRVMPDYSLLMYHNPFGGSNDEVLTKMKASLVKAISQRSGSPEQKVAAIMDRETWLDAAEAKAIGFCDRIEESAGINIPHGNTADAKAMWKQGKELTNSILNKSITKNEDMADLTTKDLKVIYNHFDLSDGTSVDGVFNAIRKNETELNGKIVDLKEQLNKAKSEKADMDGDLDKMKKELDKKKAEYDAMKEKFDKAEKDLTEAKDKAEKEKADMEEEDCKNMVTGFAKVGRIENKAEVITEWCNTAKVIGKEKVKNMIEALPLNKTATAITDFKVEEVENGLPTTAASLMARVQVQNKKK